MACLGFSLSGTGLFAPREERSTCDRALPAMAEAIMSYCFVLVYATLHTRSPFLALVGLFLVMLSIPATLAVFILASGSGEFSLMMCLSVFIVIGVGSDMLFVYTDFYKQSLQLGMYCWGCTGQDGQVGAFNSGFLLGSRPSG